MLECYFRYRGVLERLRRGPLASEIDDIAGHLALHRYAPTSARRYLCLIARFSWFAEESGHVKPESIDFPLLERFLSEIPSASTRTLARTAVACALRQLKGRSRQAGNTVSDDPDDRLVAAYDAHLKDVRGLQPGTRDGMLLLARRLLAWFREHRPSCSLAKLCGKDVLAFSGYISAASVTDGTRSASMSYLLPALSPVPSLGGAGSRGSRAFRTADTMLAPCPCA